MKGLLLVIVGFLSSCTNLFYYPQKKHVLTPQEIGLKYEDVYFESSGKKIHGWFLPVENAKGTIFFLHGNAENISTHIGSVYWLPKEGYQVFLMDYPGYGLSEGSAEIKAVHQSVHDGFSYLLSRLDVNPKTVFLLGQSIGGATGIYTAAHLPPGSFKAIIIDSAFSSYRDIFREKVGQFWLLWPLSYPLSLLVDDSYSPLPLVAELSPTPILFIHCMIDEIVPSHHSEALFMAAKEPKLFWKLEGGSHTAALHGEEYRKKLVGFLGETSSGQIK